MTRSDKASAIEQLKEKFSTSEFFYVADSSALTVDDVNKLRALCFEKGVEMQVVKNTLAVKALEQLDEGDKYTDLKNVLKGPSTILFADVANTPAKVIKEFRKSHDKPVLKAAYIDSDIYVGDDQVDSLAALKSRDELIGDVILLLQSPIKNVVSGLKSGGQTISGLLKALEERAS
jgi:large subunit ribosomal protein L10